MLINATKNMLRGQAEFSMMTRAAMRIHNEEQLEFVLDYVLGVLRPNKEDKARTALGLNRVTGKDIIAKCNEYNSEGTPVSYLSIDPTRFGLLFTLVRDEENDILNEHGTLAYVYNVDAPDCSELGYVFYTDAQQGLIKRIG